MAPVLGYWKIRGLAQGIRLLLEYTGEEYKEDLYECGNAPDFSREKWMSVKYTMGLDFPNLPYYIDGDLKLTQSEAILRYVGNKHNMGGKTAEERAVIDMLGDEVHEFRMGFARLCYNPSFDTMKADYLKDLPTKLQQFSEYLKDKKWLVGDKLSYPDFHLYDVLDGHLKLAPNCLDAFPKLKDYVKRFQGLDKIQAYMKSDRFIDKPLNNKMAKFGGDC